MFELVCAVSFEEPKNGFQILSDQHRSTERMNVTFCEENKNVERTSALCGQMLKGRQKSSDRKEKLP